MRTFSQIVIQTPSGLITPASPRYHLAFQIGERFLYLQTCTCQFHLSCSLRGPRMLLPGGSSELEFQFPVDLAAAMMDLISRHTPGSGRLLSLPPPVMQEPLTCHGSRSLGISTSHVPDVQMHRWIRSRRGGSGYLVYPGLRLYVVSRRLGQ